YVVAQRIQEVVIPVVRRSEQSCRLLHYVAVVLPDLCRRLQRTSAIGCDVQFYGRRLPLIERNSLQIFAGDYGRVDQRVERDCAETNLVAGVRGNRKRSSEFPSSG